jgi:shikimate dehydrogenase
VTSVYAVMGWPVAHSRSPAMHNAALAELGLDGVYLPLAVPPERLPDAVAAALELGVRGFNVTLPHKSAIIPLLAHVEPSARAIGAVNTVARDGGRFIGLNTDAGGLVRSLREAGVELAGATVVILGAGGAARAAVVGLAQAGAARITVAARRADQAQAMTLELAAHCAPALLVASDMGRALAEALITATLLVQATSATLDERSPGFAERLPLQLMPAGASVCDLVYQPRDTSVLRRARSLGFRGVDGLGMLLHQGALAFEHWTGEPAPLSAMRRALPGHGSDVASRGADPAGR